MMFIHGIVFLVASTEGAKNLSVLEDGIEIEGGINVDKLDGQTIIKAIDDCKNLSGRKIYSMKVKTKPGGKSSEIDNKTKITFPSTAKIHLYTQFSVKVWMNDEQSKYPIWIKWVNRKVTGTDIWDSVWSGLYYHGVTKIRLPDGKQVKDDSEVFNLDGIQDIYVDADEKAETTVPCFIEQSDGKYVKTKDFTFVMSKRKYGTYIWEQLKSNILTKDQIITSVRENSKDDNGKLKTVVKNGDSTLGSVYLGSYAFVEHVKIKVLQEFPKVDKVYWQNKEITDQSNEIVEIESILQITLYDSTIQVTLKKMF
ncbi:hypothetical protein Ddc_19957 [Ditylenchus destructor]|nr:hypothetical protein Ddc_19957 [Ditylenchus destructor]